MSKNEKILIGMNEIVISLNDEDHIMPWLSCGVPDDADEEEIKEMANDTETFEYCVSLFLDIMRDVVKENDGLYINKNVIDRNSRKN